MLLQIFVGAVVIFSCVVIHSAMIATVFVKLRSWTDRPAHRPSIISASVIVGVVALWLMLVHAVAIVAWALAFSMLGVFPDWDTTVYFSAVAFTTLGFGDVILPTDWRQLAGLCAAHGLLVFGVSSAALVEVFRQCFEDRA